MSARSDGIETRKGPRYTCYLSEHDHGTNVCRLRHVEASSTFPEIICVSQVLVLKICHLKLRPSSGERKRIGAASGASGSYSPSNLEQAARVSSSLSRLTTPPLPHPQGYHWTKYSESGGISSACLTETPATFKETGDAQTAMLQAGISIKSLEDINLKSNAYRSGTLEPNERVLFLVSEVRVLP